ncbi:MAG: helix-turn-helix transcriptional regulator [Pseudomonadota bacterium]
MGLKTSEQLRQARAALGLTQSEVAALSGGSVPTMKRLEGGIGTLSVRLETLSSIESALITQGIQFLENGDVASGFGVVVVGMD